MEGNNWTPGYGCQNRATWTHVYALIIRDKSISISGWGAPAMWLLPCVSRTLPAPLGEARSQPDQRGDLICGQLYNMKDALMDESGSVRDARRMGSWIHRDDTWLRSYVRQKLSYIYIVYVWIITYMCIIVSNEPKYCACLCVNNVLYVYNCIYEKAIKPSCILYLVTNTTNVFEWIFKQACIHSKV